MNEYENMLLFKIDAIKVCSKIDIRLRTFLLFFYLSIFTLLSGCYLKTNTSFLNEPVTEKLKLKSEFHDHVGSVHSETIITTSGTPNFKVRANIGDMAVEGAQNNWKVEVK